MSSARPFYEQKSNYCSSGIRRLQGQLTSVALLRLAAFAGIVAGTWYLIGHFSYPALLLPAAALAAFILLINIYFRLKEQRALLGQLLFVNENELSILDNQPNRLPDGAKWLNGDNYLDDLDIFGPRSLFHLLNRTTTSHGSERLAGLLAGPHLTAAAILQYQEALKILAPQADLRQLLTARGLLAGEAKGNLSGLADWLSSPSRLTRQKALLIARWLLIAWNLGAVFFYLSTNNFLPLLAGIAVSWMITGSYSRYINGQHQLISKKEAILDQYAAILSVFNTVETGQSQLLQELHASTLQAHRSIHRLSRLSSFFDQRMNMLVNTIFNSLFLYDLQCMIALERWKEDNRDKFAGWIDAVGNIECLSSLASLAYNNPDFAWPAPSADRALFIRSTGLAHPLIARSNRIANDCNIGKEERLILVTGSNMSGKTTYLRTIGVNLLLAQCGAPVCASSFEWTPMQLLTSLRISDSLQEQTSYFMAELKKLQKIVFRLQTGQPSLVLIDEILRGTNSEDKTYGSEQFIRKLLDYPCLSLFATHDLTLGTLEQELPGAVNNYCFESIIDGEELHFNYRLQRGIARNRNASFLMKKMDII